MFDTAQQLIQSADNIVIIQAENPDGDSLGSSLALEEVLSDLGKTVTLYCPVDIPKYLRYIRGWDRVVGDFPARADLAIRSCKASGICSSEFAVVKNTI